MKDKQLKIKSKPLSDRQIEVARLIADGNECKFQFLLWAATTRIDATWRKGSPVPVFRPAICAWEAWKAAWGLCGGRCATGTQKASAERPQ